MKLDFLIETGRTCPKHHCKTYWINGKERCGGCSLHRANKAAEQKIIDHYQENGDILGDHNRAIAEKRQRKVKGKREDYKSRQYID